MVKPSQQIAEEMADAAAKHRLKSPRTPTQQAILETIPLTQLIEVARAAKIHHSQWPNGKDGRCVMCSALDALKQTGNAEWL